MIRRAAVVVVLALVGLLVGAGALAPPARGDAPGATPRAPAPGKVVPHDSFIKDMDCSACHTIDGWKLAATAGTSGFDHDRTGFPLRAAHAQTACGGCHTSQARPAQACEGCHKDPHAGRMDGACFECHTPTAWADTAALEQHRRTRMPLTGKHALITCVACHKRQTERTYTALPTDCYACHRAEYHLTTTHPNHDGTADPNAPLFSRDCAQCHQTIAWKPAFANPAGLPGVMTPATARAGAHDAAFRLSSGSHRDAECASCHADPRRPRVVRCDGCHQELALRRQHPHAPVPRTAGTCLRCHPAGAAR